MNASSPQPAYAPFVHLRVHSAYSMAEGAIKIPKLVDMCVAGAMPAVALTDTRNLFGALEFSLTAAKAGIQPIIGCQLSIRRDDLPTGHGATGRAPEPDVLVVLVQNARGYAHLLKLVSHAFLGTSSGEIPQIAWSDLDGRTEGLIALTAGPSGTVGRHLLEGQRVKAEEALKRLKALFPGRLYVELMRHGMPVETRIEAAMIDLAYAHDLPLVATNEAFFADASMYEAHDALICVAEKSFVSVHDRRRLTPEHRFKSAAEMVKLFADLPEAIANTLVVAQRCAFKVDERKPILPRSPKTGDRTEEGALRELARAGLEGRLAHSVYKPDMDEAAREHAAKPYRERLVYELDMIVKMGFAGYFMIVADFIQWAKDQGIPVGPGRGSGAGSVVAWVLTITDLDPLRFGLLFERFLNPERVSMPDFDIDFCQDRREEVIRYVQREYGRDRVAQIITFGKLQARAVLRNVGRVLEMPLGYVDKICKLVPMNPAAPVKLADAIEGEPELRNLRDTDDSVAHLLDISLKLEGLYAHASTHAAGVVIGDRPLDELVPLYRDPGSDMPVTQFNMKWVESAGLVKFDFLGLKTLTVLDRAVKLLKLRGITLDVSNLPLDDRKTFDLLTRADAAGVFQFESAGMRDVLRRLKPDVFEDLIAVVALFRPGPMDNIPMFINRKQGVEKLEYLHPDLEPVLKETYGVMVYQEQVMQAAQVLAGYSLGGADLLRRAMGKKIKSEMDAQRETFITGAGARGIHRDKASEIFDTIDKFAGYGFNKSHAAAYALVAYQTAYLKTNYPVEFMAASMTLDMHNTDKLASFRAELARMRIEILPPDVNASGVEFTVENGAIRYALAAVKNVGVGAMEALVGERTERGPFKNLTDLANRLDAGVVNKRLLENLVRAGALDVLDPQRARTFAGIETLLRHAQQKSGERSSQQTSLFGGEEAVRSLTLPSVPEWRPIEKLQNEFEAIGFYLSSHPLDAYSGTLESLDVKKARDLETLTPQEAGRPIRMAGTVVSKRERYGKRGNKYAFVALSDDTGGFEVTMFSEVLAASKELLESGVPLLLTVDAQLEDDKVRLLVAKVDALERVIAARLKNLKLTVTPEVAVGELKEILQKDGRGNSRIVLTTRQNGHWIDVALPGGFAIQPKTLAGLKNIPGIADIREF
ncbi:MAG: DNA polymerase III subunit alpha [Rhodospirillaceae bacterium]|nr:MAG: DNA polymerase III subunit alpha [Rhodospirillaceae bacterium]